MTDKPPVIAVDGPAASGKGTIASRLAAAYGFAHLDTGMLYRAVGHLARLSGDPGDIACATAAARSLEAALTAGPGSKLLDDPALRGNEAAAAASQVAAIGPVRDALLDFQRRFAQEPPGGAFGAVLDGRDIGTVVCPDARLKLFVTAAPEIRAERRWRELRGRGVDAIYPQVLEDLKKRDARDSERAVAPLVPAVDAFVVDTSELDADQAFEAAFALARSRIGDATAPRQRT
jgi:cytidylate kinase